VFGLAMAATAWQVLARSDARLGPGLEP
jgi:hypothetical protein